MIKNGLMRFHCANVLNWNDNSVQYAALRPATASIRQSNAGIHQTACHNSCQAGISDARMPSSHHQQQAKCWPSDRLTADQPSVTGSGFASGPVETNCMDVRQEWSAVQPCPLALTSTLICLPVSRRLDWVAIRRNKTFLGKLSWLYQNLLTWIYIILNCN